MDATSGTRVEENKATVRRMLASLSAGDVQGFVAGLSLDWVRHCQAMPPELQELRGREGMRDWLASNQVSFPDRREEIVILGMHRFEGGLVAETWTSWDNVAALTQLGLMPSP